jgi:hypothetical protein
MKKKRKYYYIVLDLSALRPIMMSLPTPQAPRIVTRSITSAAIELPQKPTQHRVSGGFHLFLL